MTDKILKTLNEFNMLLPGDSVCVAVSGGADSMCLLHFLFENRKTLGVTVAAAHVNHCIRGEEADRDENYVRDYCRARGIPLHVKKINIPVMAKREGVSTELCARNKRYEFFSVLPYAKIATAHTGSDCVETMLMNLSRGTSLHGLCSIPPVRNNIIRPLIGCTRDETESYCRENGIDFVTDSTNLTDDYTRNKFRHSVLGLLKNINVSFEQNAMRCLCSLRQDDDFISAAASDVFTEAYNSADGCLRTSAVADAHPAVAKRVLAYYFKEVLHSDCEAKHINFFFDTLRSGGSVTLPSGITVANKNGRIFPVRAACDFSTVPEKMTFFPSDGFSGDFGETAVTVFLSDKTPGISVIPEDETCTAVVDADKISGKVTLRTRQPGDSIPLAGRHCTKTLKKLFTEKNIPIDMRGRIPVVACADKIVAVPGIGVSKDYAVTGKTKNYMIIKMIIKSERDKNGE